jgi:hypothetical protein
MRVLAIIFGVLLLLPGLCFLGFGFMFASSGQGFTWIGLGEIVLGGLITWGAIAMIRG